MPDTGYPTHSWPPPESPEFIPAGWMPLFDAFNELGKARFHGEWMDGTEIAARPTAEIAEDERRWRDALAKRSETLEKLKGLPPVSAKARSTAIKAPIRQIPELFPNKEAEIAARARAGQTWSELRQWLFAGLVPAIIFDWRGKQHTVPKPTWSAPSAILALHRGRTRAGGESGYVLLSETHLHAAIGSSQGSSSDDGSAALTDGAKSEDSTEKVTPGPGRPSQRPAIIGAYEKLRSDGKINFDAPKLDLYPDIREIITGEPHTVAKGLGDEAIRLAIAPLFDTDKAKARAGQ